MAQTANMYELTYIVNAVLSEEQTKKLIGRISEFLKENGAEILDVEEWGSQRLAYPIEKKRNGYYVNLYFKAPAELIVRLERILEIEDNVMRYLTLRYDAKMMRHYELRKEGLAKAALEEEEAAVAAEEEEDDE